MMLLSLKERPPAWLIAIVAATLWTMQSDAAEPDDLRLEYARQLLARAGSGRQVGEMRLGNWRLFRPCLEKSASRRASISSFRKPARNDAHSSQSDSWNLRTY